MTESEKNIVNCPNCGEVIQLDEKGYNQILDQVKGQELDRRTEQIQKQYDERARLYEQMVDERAAERENRIKAEAEKELESKISEARKHYALLRISKEAEISGLKAALENNARETELAVANAEAKKDKMIYDLNERICTLEETLSNKDTLANSEFARIRAQLEGEKASALMKLQSKSEKESSELREKIKVLETECSARGDMIKSLKDFRSKLSTKMLGESLEQYCEQEYDRALRPALTNATFIKDTHLGQKGDFIFRETDEDGTETLSILFDMKTEDDLSGGGRKKKNRDHLEKLDQDRKRRGCEYAVLVSTLEPDNDLYNAGIVCVTEYEKMYVVRPQVFIDLIHILRSLSADKACIKKALEIERSKSIDITDFEDNLEAYKGLIAGNTDRAVKFSDDAVVAIDRIISSMEKMKEKLLSWKGQNQLAKAKADKLTIKILAKNNATVGEMFEAIAESGEPDIIEIEESDIETISMVESEDAVA